MRGAAAMSLSSFCVVSNALRLNLLDIHDKSRDKKIKHKKEKTMERTMKIEGMMCPHCEARVKKCLEALPEVTEAKVSHKDGTAIVVLASDVSDDVLKKTVEDQGYTVL
jgi:Cu2+-exporting ATPase